MHFLAETMIPELPYFSLKRQQPLAPIIWWEGNSMKKQWRKNFHILSYRYPWYHPGPVGSGRYPDLYLKGKIDFLKLLFKSNLTRLNFSMKRCSDKLLITERGKLLLKFPLLSAQIWGKVFCKKSSPLCWVSNLSTG